MQLDADQLVTVLAEKIGELPETTALIGIHTGGVWVANALREKFGNQHAIGSLAATLHRDDFGARGLHPLKKTSDIPFDVEGRNILLIDDVIYSGRTIRAALNELFDFGRPASVRLAVLIDRGHRELPFAADYVAMQMPLEASQDLVLSNEHDRLRFSIRDRNP